MESPAQTYLELYDRQLRTGAETAGALHVDRLGPLYLATFSGGRGFITYPHVTAGDRPALAELAGPALDYFLARPQVTEVEFKTRAHDVSPGLHEALLALGFVQQEAESIMIGPLEALAGKRLTDPAPPGLRVRRVREAAQVRELCRVSDQAFGEPFDAQRAAEIEARVLAGDGMQLWAAFSGTRMVGTGRLEPVPGTEFVGLWGGGVLPEFRGRGVYRALTEARARSALAAGYRLVHSDSTEYSRPILERQGLLKVSTTTPYEWSRE